MTTATDHNHTIIFTDHECIAVSAAILKAGEHGHRGDTLEAARRKLRAALDGHIARNFDEHDEPLPKWGA